MVGADTITENVGRLGLTPAEVVRLLAAELGHEVVVLGTPRGRFDHDLNRVEPSGQASYHVDLDVALLGRDGDGRRTALVADPRARPRPARPCPRLRAPGPVGAPVAGAGPRPARSRVSCGGA